MYRNIVTMIRKNSVMKDIDRNGVIVIIGFINTCILVLINDMNTQQTPICTRKIKNSVIRPPRVPNVTLVTSINVATTTRDGCGMMEEVDVVDVVNNDD